MAARSLATTSPPVVNAPATPYWIEVTNLIYPEHQAAILDVKTVGPAIIETDLVVHAGHLGDFFPHHLDAEFYKTLPFGQRMAEGTLVFTIGIGLTATITNPVAFSYGDDRMCFAEHFFFGDTIRSRVKITGTNLMEKSPRLWSGDRVAERQQSDRRDRTGGRSHL